MTKPMTIEELRATLLSRNAMGGRPRLPVNQRTVNVSVALMPAQVAWLRSRPEGISVTVRNLVAKGMQEAAKV